MWKEGRKDDGNMPFCVWEHGEDSHWHAQLQLLSVWKGECSHADPQLKYCEFPFVMSYHPLGKPAQGVLGARGQEGTAKRRLPLVVPFLISVHEGWRG